MDSKRALAVSGALNRPAAMTAVPVRSAETAVRRENAPSAGTIMSSLLGLAATDDVVDCACWDTHRLVEWAAGENACTLWIIRHASKSGPRFLGVMVYNIVYVTSALCDGCDRLISHIIIITTIFCCDSCDPMTMSSMMSVRIIPGIHTVLSYFW
jgi:hypothetical protein